MPNEKRLIDYEQAKRATYEEIFWSESEQAVVRHFLAKLPKVDAVEEVRSRVDDTIFEVDPEHGVVKHKIYEVCVVYKTTATDDNGMEWDDFYTSDDIDTAYKTRQEAEANLCSYGERKAGE